MESPSPVPPAFARSNFVREVITVEDVRQVGFGDSNSGIVHPDLGNTPIALEAEADFRVRASPTRQ